MPTHYTLRIQFGTEQDPEILGAQLLALAREARVDEFMIFFYGEELNDAHPTLAQVQGWIEHSRPYRKCLADEGVLISLNPWHSLLHADRGRSLKAGQDWQTIVDPGGRWAVAFSICLRTLATVSLARSYLPLISSVGGMKAKPHTARAVAATDTCPTRPQSRPRMMPQSR